MAADDDPPNPFPDPHAEDVAIKVNQALPGSNGGPIESLKRAVMQALRSAMTGTTMTLNSSEIKVSMQYPMTPALDPGIWIQFDYTDLSRAGIDHEAYRKMPDGKWVTIQEWIYFGRVTMTVVAYTSLERDRISDALIDEIAFARTPELVMTDPDENTNQFRSLITTLNRNPHVSLSINTDSLNPGSQSMSVGTPWDDFQQIYEDTYSFELVGQFNVAFNHDGHYRLAAIDVDTDVTLESDDPDWTPWV